MQNEEKIKNMEQKLTQRSWRKLVKKLQRKRRRQKLAKERDKELADGELKKLKDPLYKSWLENQQELERLKLLAEKNERDEQEEQWMRRELIAQKQFEKDEQKRKELESAEEAERAKQEAELMKQEEVKQKKRDELKKQMEKTAKEFEEIMNSMQEYLENDNMKTPRILEKHVESRPGVKLCEFYAKTNCCRFGPGCSFNHKRPMLTQIIVIRHFFQHPLLEQQKHKEYASGEPNLELDEQDLRESYDEFCKDVWPELERFGKIVNFRTVRNVHLHLRGHVFVEFAEKRHALKAFTKLQNRFYASKRLTVEFSNISHWRSAVCGMLSRNLLKGLSLGHKCPKGSLCSFLHLMKNPKNKYNTSMSWPAGTPRNNNQSSKTPLATPLLSWENLDDVEATGTKHRKWRWSETPEMELNSNKTSETTVSYSPKNNAIPNSSEVIQKSSAKSPNSKRHHQSKFSDTEETTNSNYSNSRRLSSPTLDDESIRHNANGNSSPEKKKSVATTKENLKHHKIRKSKSPKSSHHKRRRHKSKSPSKEYKSKHKKSKKHKNKEGKS